MSYYLYCIADTDKKSSLGPVGIAKSDVMVMPVKSLSAVVHQMEGEPPALDDKENAIAWVEGHQSVVEDALKRYKTVLPFSFGTIIRGDEDELKKWVEKEYDRLTKSMAKVHGKAEYGVQIFWQPSDHMEKLIDSKNELKELKSKSESESSGTAYMYKKRFEKALKDDLEHEAEVLFRRFFERIKECVSDIAIEKIKNLEGDKQMLLNVSCLADEKEVKKLGDVLEDIGGGDERLVRFTGPWPPYSFVSI